MEWTEKQTTKGKCSKENNSNGHSFVLLSSSEAIDILTKAELKLATFRSLASLSDSSTISYRHLPYLDTSLTLFYNTEFTNDRDVEEHDTHIDSVLNSWSMSRDRIQKDGDCCFRSVARNLMRLTEEGVISPTLNENLTDLGLFDANEEELMSRLKRLTVAEWEGKREFYERFLTEDSFEEEIERFRQQGYFTGELGNLMVLVIANILKMPITTYSSLEHYEVIPVLPHDQLLGMPIIFLAFNAAGCGHCDFVMASDQVTTEPEEATRQAKRHELSCACGMKRKGTAGNICNSIPGSYSTRCNCYKLRVGYGESCRCKGCANPYRQQKAPTTMECVPRKRRKHEFQKSSNLKSEAYLESKGEALREGPMTEAEFFVLEAIIRHARDNGEEELTSTYLLEHYNFVQTINSSLDPKPFELRQKMG